MSEPIFEPNFLNLEYLFNKIYHFFIWLFDVLGGLHNSEYLPYIKTIISILDIIFIAGIIYAFLRIYEIRKEELSKFKLVEADTIEKGDVDSEAKRNPQWEIIQKMINSNEPAQWRLAIINADALLDELVKTMGYIGDTFGERMKKIEKSDFNTLSEAWEAHKVRNRVAHEGSDFLLNSRMAQETISLYEKVFKEFRII